jgi:hypothetical protein
MTNTKPVSPDCRDGNHQKCTGTAWNLDTDSLEFCRCDVDGCICPDDAENDVL